MNFRSFSVLFALAVCATATTAEAAVHRVFPDQSIQAAIDGASPGDTILVEPGTYQEAGRVISDDGTKTAGLHITTDNLRLIGKARPGQGEDGKVILLHSDGQYTGVYAAPDGCGHRLPVGECEDELQGFYIRGFTVKNFPGDGIQTRFVNGFKIIRNESSNNKHNGIYPTISANGLVQNNVSYGASDTAMWVAASQNVRVIGNDLSESPIGLEVNVSLNVEVRHNNIHNNTVGIGLFHPNTAGNDPLPVMGNWVVEHNNVYDNNVLPDDLPNPAPPGSFQGELPPGVGILVLGVSNNVVGKNTVENNDFVGIGVLGWCTAAFTIPGRDCVTDPPFRGGVLQDPSVSNNLIAQNEVRGNGTNPPAGPLEFLAADITYFSFWPEGIFPPPNETSSGNCFEKNKPKDGFTASSYDAFPGPPFFGTNGPLPTDGC